MAFSYYVLVGKGHRLFMASSVAGGIHGKEKG